MNNDLKLDVNTNVNQNKTNGYLYILQRNDKKGTNIYKIGMTEQSIFNRINKEASYRDCFIVETRAVDNGRKAENDLKQELKNKNIKRCKDVDENYQGIEDYIIDDINCAVKIFNEVCDRNDITVSNESQKIILENKPTNVNPLTLLKDEIYDNNFADLIDRRKSVIEFLGSNKRDAFVIWLNNFDKIFKPIEIYSGLNYSKSNTYKTFLIDVAEMYKLSNFNKTITITKFRSHMSIVCDRYCSNQGKVSYRTEFNTSVNTSARLYLMEPSSIKLLLGTSYVLSKYTGKYTPEFIKTLYKYDSDECNEIIKNKISNYDQEAIEYCLYEKYSLVIDNTIDRPKLNRQLKIISINKLDYNRFRYFELLFRNNPNIDYELLTQYKLLTNNNCEDFILYVQNLDILIRCLLNDNSSLVNVLIEFLYDKIYTANNCKNKLYASKFKNSWYKEFEQQYKNIANLSSNIKSKLYSLLDEYVNKNNKLNSMNMFISCRY